MEEYVSENLPLDDEDLQAMHLSTLHFTILSLSFRHCLSLSFHCLFDTAFHYPFTVLSLSFRHCLSLAFLDLQLPWPAGVLCSYAEERW